MTQIQTMMVFRWLTKSIFSLKVADFDRDGLPDDIDPDDDNDNVRDTYEWQLALTLSTQIYDGDGLNDGSELQRKQTLKLDTDGDGYVDPIDTSQIHLNI